MILTNSRYGNAVRLALHSTMVYLLVCGKHALHAQRKTHTNQQIVCSNNSFSLFFSPISRCSFFRLSASELSISLFQRGHPPDHTNRPLYAHAIPINNVSRHNTPLILHPSHIPLPIFHHPLTQDRFKNSQGLGEQNCQNVTSHHRLRNSESQ